MSHPNQIGIKSIRSLLCSDSSSHIANIYKHATLIHELNHELKKLLPLPMRDNCILVNIKNGSAIFHTQSSAWATRLRLSAPEIRDILHRLNLTQVKSVRVRVSLPDGERQYINRRPKPVLTRETSNLLNLFAESIPYVALRASLKRLSQNTDADK